MNAICKKCGHKVLVDFPTEEEMQIVLRGIGWICVNIDGVWLMTCPTCRKEIQREID